MSGSSWLCIHKKMAVNKDRHMEAKIEHSANRTSTFCTMMFYSVAMFTLPFVAYFMAKNGAESQFYVASHKSYLWGVVASVIMVHIIIFGFVYEAFHEVSDSSIMPEETVQLCGPSHKKDV